MTPSLPLRRSVIVVAALVAGCAAVPADLRRGSAREDVAATERAFAATMAARDHAAFTAFLAPDAVFVSGTRTLRGRSEVAAAWRRFYDRPEAPFSWEPETVEVLDSGTLALSTGPVRDPRGKLDCPIHLHLAPGSAGDLAHRFRFRRRCLRLRAPAPLTGTACRRSATAPCAGIRSGLPLAALLR